MPPTYGVHILLPLITQHNHKAVTTYIKKKTWDPITQSYMRDHNSGIIFCKTNFSIFKNSAKQQLAQFYALRFGDNMACINHTHDHSRL